MLLLTDPSPSVYVVLVALTLASAAAAYFFQPWVFAAVAQLKSRQWPAGVGRLLLIVAAPLVLLTVFVCDAVYESDYEESARRMEEIAAGVSHRSVDEVFRHVSEKFKVGGALDREGLKRVGERAFRSGDVTGMSVWDFERASVERTDTTVRFEHKFAVTGNGVRSDPRWTARVEFARDADGRYRLVGFDIFHYEGGQKQLVSIPQVYGR